MLPVAPVQSGVQMPPPLLQPTANAYSLPSPEPTYTTPSATAGEDRTLLPVAPVQSGAQVPPPLLQPTANADSLPS